MLLNLTTCIKDIIVDISGIAHTIALFCSAVFTILIAFCEQTASQAKSQIKKVQRFAQGTPYNKVYIRRAQSHIPVKEPAPHLTDIPYLSDIPFPPEYTNQVQKSRRLRKKFKRNYRQQYNI